MKKVYETPEIWIITDKISTADAGISEPTETIEPINPDYPLG